MLLRIGLQLPVHSYCYGMLSARACLMWTVKKGWECIKQRQVFQLQSSKILEEVITKCCYNGANYNVLFQT